jgi:Uma2 family endonuclease
MAAVRKPRYTPEEYLALERRAEYKSEYFAGEIFAMAEASPVHNAIVFNAAGALFPQLRGGPCRGYGSDLRVKVSESGLYTYPDLVVACGEPEFDDEHRDTLLNPTLLLEVLSTSTEAYDRGGKFAQYRRLESLQEYVLVSQDEYRVEWFVRQPDGRWLLSEAKELTDLVQLSSIRCDLALADLYDRVEMDASGGDGSGASAGGSAEQTGGR